jgi:hypothetical protein
VLPGSETESFVGRIQVEPRLRVEHLQASEPDPTESREKVKRPGLHPLDGCLFVQPGEGHLLNLAGSSDEHLACRSVHRSADEQLQLAQAGAAFGQHDLNFRGDSQPFPLGPLPAGRCCLYTDPAILRRISPTQDRYRAALRRA